MLVYILAASHSGSTLLSMLLNAHPGIVTAGELKAVHIGGPKNYRCSCHAPIGDCEFWRSVSEKMRGLGHDFKIWQAETHYPEIDSRYVNGLLRPLHRGPTLEALRDAALQLSPTWRREFPEYLERNADLVKSVAAASGSAVVVESSKIAVRLKFVLRMPEINVRVIRLLRDGRAVALTYMQPGEYADAKDAELRGGGFGNSEFHKSLKMQDAAHQWRRCNEEAEQILAGIPSSEQFSTSYEEVCRNPTETLNKIFTFLGVPAMDSVDSFRSSEHHVIGNGMRLDTDNRIQLDERWRTAHTEADLALFDSVAGSLNQRYGYH